jgi:Stress responsive A/B Barrel Domain
MEAIQHMVIFDIKHPAESPLTDKFLKDGLTILSQIPGVKNFQVFNQISPKNDFRYGFSMNFDSKVDFENYNIHPAHVSFVQDRWMNEVSRFQEIDFKALIIK